MDFKIEAINKESFGDDQTESILLEILTGLKAKMVQPVLDENQKLSEQLQELIELERSEMAELKERIAVLDARLQQIPLIILASFRDAINQTGKEEQNGGE